MTQWLAEAGLHRPTAVWGRGCEPQPFCTASVWDLGRLEDPCDPQAYVPPARASACCYGSVLRHPTLAVHIACGVTHKAQRETDAAQVSARLRSSVWCNVSVAAYMRIYPTDVYSTRTMHVMRFCSSVLNSLFADNSGQSGPAAPNGRKEPQQAKVMIKMSCCRCFPHVDGSQVTLPSPCWPTLPCSRLCSARSDVHTEALASPAMDGRLSTGLDMLRREGFEASKRPA